MKSEQKHEMAGFAVGVMLLFVFMMSSDLIIPNARPLLSIPVHIAYTFARALFANILLLIITRWINLKLDNYIPWYPAALKRLIIQGIITVLVSTVIISGIVVTLILFVGPYANKEIIIPKALIFSNIFALTLTILYTGVYFFNQWGRSHMEAEKQKHENLQSQFITLKNQISPHFLFNSLNTLSNLISEDQGKATDFVQNLAQVYRYVLQSMDKNVVDLDTELKVARSYVYLQQSRFGKSIQVNIQIPDELMKLGIAPFTIQILLENAIKHNVVSNDKPLTVHILEKDGIKLIVKNNLQRKSSVEYGAGIGLKNIVNRYSLLIKKEIEIYETDSEFTVEIPLLKDYRL